MTTPYEEGNGAYTQTARSQRERADSDLETSGRILLISRINKKRRLASGGARSWATFTAGESS